MPITGGNFPELLSLNIHIQCPEDFLVFEIHVNTLSEFPMIECHRTGEIRKTMYCNAIIGLQVWYR